MVEPRYSGRFAPSPTGPLHWGSLLVALASWLLARQARGEWMVRVEDIDPPREKAGAREQQLATLEALGLRPDAPVLRQSTRGAAYAAALDELARRGEAFACHCSRSDLGGEDGVHRHCVASARRETPAWRLRTPERVLEFTDLYQGRLSQSLGETVGNFVLKRADGFWAYQLAVVVDDAAQGITHVVRGADLLDSTPRQILLQERLGLPHPQYAHLPVLLGPDGRKLSKSLDADAVRIEQPLQALRRLWRALGQDAWNGDEDAPERWLEQAVSRFRSDAVPRRPALAWEAWRGAD